MIHLVQQTIQASRPSQDEQFTQRVSFFTAILDGDVKQTRALMRANPDLFQETAEWKLAIQRHYWTGSPAIHLAVSRGDIEMTQALLAHNSKAAVTLTTRGTEMTALHCAAIMKRHELAQILLDRGADVNALSTAGQTALHIAGLRGDTQMAQILLQHGARTDLTDGHGHSPGDLATLQNHADFVALLREHGARLPVMTSPALPQPDRSADVLLTGIKVIDFLAPIQRGGTLGVFTPASGIGFLVVISQIIRSVQTLYNGHIVIAALESHEKYNESWRLFLRESDSDQNVSYIMGDITDEDEQRLRVAQRAKEAVASLRADGKEVLLVVSSNLAGTEGALPLLSGELGIAEGFATTLLVFGHHTAGLEPAPLDNLDTVIAFGGVRGAMRWYPAVSEVRSRSRLFETTLRGTLHADAASQAYRLLYRYADLHVGYEHGGMDTLWYIDDDPHLEETITRARQLHCFLTQPLYGAEPWTGTLGCYLSLEETVAGCRAILQGDTDNLPEDVLKYIGALDEAVEKARTS